MAGANEVGIKLRVDSSQVQAGAQQASQALQTLAGSTRAVGAGAKLTGYQTAQLSAQLQDLFVQVQAGGSPMTALLQQGSQLSAVFGGVGGAMRAVGALITPTVAAIGAGAAAVGSLAYAYAQGEKERQAFARGLVLTGNAAGTTASQLGDLATALQDVGGRGAAADALAQLTASGRVAAGALGQAAEAALRLQREAGTAVEDTVKTFERLGRSPLQALRELNEAQNFLTVSTYRQVKALVDQGREADAARLAQETWAAATIARTKELEGQLGTLESAWRKLAGAARAGWNAILNVGAPTTISSQIAELEKAIALAEGSSFANSPKARAAIDEQRARLDTLRETARLETRAAAAVAENAAATRKAIAATDDLDKARKTAADATERLVEQGRQLAQSLQLEAAGLSGNFLQQWAALNAAYKAGALSVDAVREAQARLLAQQPAIRAAAEQELSVAQALARARADLRSAEDKAVTDYLDKLDRERAASLASVQARLQALTDEEQAAQMAAAGNVALAVAIEQVALARLQEQQARLQEGSKAWEDVQREIEARERLLQLIGSREARAASQRAAADAANDWQRTSDQIGQSLSDALMQGGKSAAEYIKGLFRTMVLRPIVQAIVQPVVGALLGSAGGAGGGAGNLNTLASLYGAGSRAYGWMTGGTAAASGASAAQMFTAGYQGSAASLGAGTVGPVTNGAGGAMGAGASTSTAASYAGWAALAAAVYMRGASDYDKGFDRAAARRTGTIAGRVTADTSDLLSRLGVSDRIADIFGATAVAATIGRAAPRVERAGVSGTISGGGFSGQQFADIIERGGLLRSNKRYTQLSELAPELDRFFDDAAASIMDKARAFGAALGLPAEQLANVSTDIRVALTDDAEANQRAITEALGTYGDALVKGFADAVRPLAIYGETTAQTLERVGSALVGVNAVLDALGLSALAASVDGGKAAVALQDMFGGIAGLQQAAGAYLQDYYTDAERAALTTRALGAALADVGLALPDSRAAFRDLVEAQDLSTESGRAAFGVLMDVAGAFAAITPSAEDLATALAEAEQRIVALRRSIVDGLYGVIADFASGAQLDELRAVHIRAILAGAGIETTTEVILNATRDDIVELWNAVGDAGKAAILEAYGTWVQMQADIRADRIDAVQAQLDAITSTYGDVVGAMAADTELLTDAYRRNKSELQTLEQGLDDLLGTATRTVQQTLADLLQTQRALDGLAGGLRDDLQDAQLRTMSPSDRIAALRATEATLFAQLPGAADPVAVAQRLQNTVLQRIRLEADGAVQALDEQLRTQRQLRDAQMDALREQISGAERLLRLSQDIAQFTGSLRFSDISPLSFERQLGAARGLFQGTLAGARAGDPNAQSNLVGNARAYLDEARSYYASSGAYASIFASVTGALDALGLSGADAGGQVSELQQQLDALAALNDSQAELRDSLLDTSAAEVQALGSILAAVDSRRADEQQRIDEQTALAREQIAELRTVVENQQAQIAQQAAIAQALIAQLRELNTSTDALVRDAELEAAAP